MTPSFSHRLDRHIRFLGLLAATTALLWGLGTLLISHLYTLLGQGSYGLPDQRVTCFSGCDGSLMNRFNFWLVVAAAKMGPLVPLLASLRIPLMLMAYGCFLLWFWIALNRAREMASDFEGLHAGVATMLMLVPVAMAIFGWNNLGSVTLATVSPDVKSRKNAVWAAMISIWASHLLFVWMMAGGWLVSTPASFRISMLNSLIDGLALSAIFGSILVIKASGRIVFPHIRRAFG